MTDDVLLSISDLHTFYGRIPVLKGISVELKEGGVQLLLGANGAGKSTLLKAVLGLVRVARGSIKLQGDELRGLRPDQVHRHGIAWAPQGRQTFSTLSVQENLEMGCFLETNRRGVAERLEEAFDRFPVLGARRRQVAGSLSGGEQQSLSIARALMSKPRLILMDEPSVGLSPQAIETMFDLVRTICEQGVTVMLVEQNARSAIAIASWVYVLENGRVATSAAPDALMLDEAIQQAYLGLEN